MCRTFTVQSLVDGHVGCFYLIATVIRGSMNIDKHISRVGYGALWVYGRDKPTSRETATLISMLHRPPAAVSMYSSFPTPMPEFVITCFGRSWAF